MLFDFRIFGLSFSLIVWNILRYTEAQKWWTLRLTVSRWIPAGSLLVISVVGFVLTVRDYTSTYPFENLYARAGLAILTTVFAYVLLRILLPLYQSRIYVALRWKAWTGPSRTGIASAMTRYLGNRDDWRSLTKTCTEVQVHPVEAFLRWSMPFTRGILYDPTELLKRRLRMDEELDAVWVPESDVKEGVYAPFDYDQPVSFLWGAERNLFVPRCSRAIIAVPRNLLSFQPKLKNGVDGRALCLAHGILARNKGLEPHRLVCNLNNQPRLRAFEENSALWPRPSKALRSFYHSEMKKSFSGLGENYVNAATELALLLADSHSTILSDWLDGHMEHQDLNLNREIATLGASTQDLSRLYRGQYVAMLVSLSEHRIDIRTRPEITVFRALCQDERLENFPDWLSDPSMVEREASEARILGQRGTRLIEAAV